MYLVAPNATMTDRKHQARRTTSSVVRKRPHGPRRRMSSAIAGPRPGSARMGATVELMTMTTRRYGDDEVQEIFRLATEGERRDPSLPVDPGGLRLAELQRIGQEAGIEPERVAAAAAALAARGRPLPVQRAFGLPIGIARVVDLPRAPTDREWEQLVAQCRTTFAVQGQATIEGGLRTWSHGNLHLSIEPTADGERLRLHSRSEAAELLNGIGTGVGGLSLLMSGVVAAAGKPEKALAVLGMFGGIALAAFLTNVVRAPRWARERDRQMTALAAHAVHLLSHPAVHASSTREKP